MRRVVLAAVLLAGAAQAEPYDVPWFQANPSALADTVRRCADDARLRRGPICENARSANTRGRLGRPLPSDTPFEREMRAIYGMRRT